MAKVIFSFNGIKAEIQCLKEDKMINICKKYVSKINVDLNSLYFLYSGQKINLDLTFNELSNNIDKNTNRMKILVFQYENEKFICPKCGERIKFNRKILMIQN